MIVPVAMKVPVLRSYLPPRLIVHAASDSGQGSTTTQLEGLVSLMRSETADDHLGGRALLNALSTAMFALVLRLASEAHDAPRGLLAVAGHPRLAPAMVALFQNPSRAWSLPELARLCNMSRATFVRQFQDKLGRSAADLTNVSPSASGIAICSSSRPPTSAFVRRLFDWGARRLRRRR